MSLAASDFGCELNEKKEGLYDEVSQKILENHFKMLLGHFLKQASDPTKEKFVHSFCEGIYYYEEVLLLKEGIHPCQLPQRYQMDINEPKGYTDKQEAIRQKLIIEIRKQYRQFTIFLSGIK